MVKTYDSDDTRDLATWLAASRTELEAMTTGAVAALADGVPPLVLAPRLLGGVLASIEGGQSDVLIGALVLAVVDRAVLTVPTATSGCVGPVAESAARAVAVHLWPVPVHRWELPAAPVEPSPDAWATECPTHGEGGARDGD